MVWVLAQLRQGKDPLAVQPRQRQSQPKVEKEDVEAGSGAWNQHSTGPTWRWPAILAGRAGSVHIRRMKGYGTNIVAGVSARAGAESVEGVPLFTDCGAAAAAT